MSFSNHNLPVTSLPLSAYWAKMNESQKTGVRVGMFPLEIMQQIEKEMPHIPPGKISLYLMDCAAHDGGMIG